jgi:hypothetical protein
MALTFPRDPVVEFYLDRWRDVSAHLRQTAPVTVTDGRKDWAPKTSPAVCRFTLDDGPGRGNGDYDPNNPMGQWFDYWSQNRPVRYGLRYGRDDFSRVSAAGWTASPNMGAWSTFTGTGTLASDITGGNGRHLITATASYIAHYLDDVNTRNVELYDEFSLGTFTAAGGNVEPSNLMLRGLDSGTYYMLRTTLTTTGQLTLTIMFAGALTMAGPVTVLAYPGITSTVGVRFQADANTLRGKIWRTDLGEPLDWHIEYSLNPDLDIMLGAGWVGIRDGVAGGNTNPKPVVISHTAFEVIKRRFTGETSKMVPKMTVDHRDIRTEFEASSLRRRLSRGEKVLDTVLSRYITRGGLPFGVSDFWPLDYETDVLTPGANLVGAGLMRFVQSTGGSLKWGTDTGLLQVKRAVTIVAPGTGHSGQMYAPIDATRFTAGNGHAAVWLQRVGSDRQASCLLDLTVGQVFLKFDPGLATIQWLDGINPPATVMTVGVPQVGDDTVWHMIAFGVRQSGASAIFDLMIDDNPYSTTRAATTVGVPEGIQWSAFPDTVDGYEITQALIMTVSMFTGAPWYITTLRDVYMGRTMEHAGDRFTRLCLEEGVHTALIGSATNTPAIGPQRPDTLLNLTQECIDVAQGTALDPLGTNGLGMRTRRSTVAQDPVFTLDYAAHNVAPDFGTPTDDQEKLNDLTVKRPLGGQYRIQQLTGPNNVNDPGTVAGAAGRYDNSITVPVASDAQLPDQAAWRVHLGTVDGARYPTVTVDLRAASLLANPDLVAAVLDAGVDDRIDIINAVLRRIYDTVRFVVRGYTETLDTNAKHKIVFNTTPYQPYDVAVYGDTESRYDTAGSALAGTLSTVATSFSVNITSGELWTTDAAQFPMDVTVGGQRIRISAISGTGPQTFTVASGGLSINGVLRSHAAGTPVQLFRERYYE